MKLLPEDIDFEVWVWVYNQLLDTVNRRVRHRISPLLDIELRDQAHTQLNNSVKTQ